MDIKDLQGLFTAARLSGSASAGGENTDHAVATEMRLNRQASMAKQSALGANNISLTVPRPADPRFYWRNSSFPYDFSNAEHIKQMREICRAIANAHPTIGSVIDTYATYPLAGMEIVCPKSPEIADFYQQLFMEQLHYDEFLVDAGKEYWKVGESFPYGTFNELLGTWESDELMLPEDVKVVKSPFLMEPRMEMKLPAYIRKIIIERRPQQEYVKLITAYPELVAYARSGEQMLSAAEDEDDPRVWIPVSNMVMSHIKHSVDHFTTRGVSIIMRALRALIQEEKLNSAQEAIADRLYTPFILAKIGASATDLGTDTPWIPTAGDLEAFLDDINAAMAADFRLAVHHFAVQIDNVFGRETIPDLTSDFERLEGKYLQAFGMSKTMLSGASSGETYAADALNRDLLTQLLTTFQKRMKRFVRHRAEVVAEAQGHYDFEMKGGRAVPIMEEIVVTNDEGQKRIDRRPKLLLPDLRIRSMNMKDEDNLHALLEALRQSGVPISMRSRLVNIPINLEDEVEAVMQEQVDQAVAAQEARRKTYIALKQKGLPIAEDLRADFEPKVITPGQPQEAGQDVPLDTVGITDPASTTALAPTPEQISTGEVAGVDQTGGSPTVQKLPRNRALSGESNRVPESDEQREGMPKAASLDTVDAPSTVWANGIGSEVLEMDHRIAMTDRLIDGDSGIVVESVPVLGSWLTRHVGHRDESFFFKDEEQVPA